MNGNIVSTRYPEFKSVALSQEILNAKLIDNIYGQCDQDIWLEMEIGDIGRKDRPSSCKKWILYRESTASLLVKAIRNFLNLPYYIFQWNRQARVNRWTGVHNQP